MTMTVCLVVVVIVVIVVVVVRVMPFDIARCCVTHLPQGNRFDTRTSRAPRSDAGPG
ncbi:MAG: hypothetical protein QOD52_445 [Gaiellaceae bacterium]|nr:hypothetical protein [Gaiellaceae bacterium]